MDAVEFDIIIANKYVDKIKHAKKSGIEFKLTFAQFKRIMQRKRCAYSGIEFADISKPENNWQKITIDRIDNKKGYIPGNVIAVCNGVNNIKSQWENPNIPIDIPTMERIIRNVKKYSH